ncbi:MAG: choline/carnitine O-acyltransferase [Rhizobiales bacterium]|nr:choline/carnitine O-acyltransferase [Hyphomicrobiales bacterium]
MSNSTVNTAGERQEGTFVYEETLPKVPLPELSVTKEKFIEWCSPLLSEAELNETKKALEAFTNHGGLGEKLHGALQEFDAHKDTKSWLDVFWPSRYLGRRDPIALNANFFFLFRHEELNQAERAAKIAASALNYKLLLDKEEIPVAKLKDTPLSMDQVKYLFSATRIPGDPQDTLRSFYSDAQPGPSTARHILVFSRAKIYVLDVVAENGTPHSYADIKAGMVAILEASAGERDEKSVGHLTTMRRAEWAKAREVLKSASFQNKDNLDLIETALFSINLDDITPASELEACDNLLHGGSGNRWYDTALQLIVFENGMAGINIEHCGLDGTTILNFVDTILDCDLDGLDAQMGAETQGTPSFQKLEFKLTSELDGIVSKAAEDFKNLRQTTITRTYDLPEWGGKHIKSLGMSPDAFAQCAMQLAHYRTKGFIGATYESIATRQYCRGRTEAMRTVTPEVFKFVETIESSNASQDEKIKAFREAATKHVERAKQCQQGHAPEQHLWELQNIYNRNPELFAGGFMGKILGGKLSKDDCENALKLFESPGWIKMRQDSLSTSSAPSPTILYFGFGSTGPGCIGVGYLVRSDVINCYLSTAQGEEEALESFIKHYDLALRELSNLLESEIS